MHVVSAARRHPVPLQFGVEPLHMLWRELLQAVCTEAGDQVPVHVDAVSEMGVLGDVRRGRDVDDPILQPSGYGPALPSRPCPAAVTLPFQVADLARHLGAGGATHVATIGPSVVAHAHGDPADPAPVPVLVDRGPVVRVPASLRSRRVLFRRRWCHWWLPSFACGAVWRRTRRGTRPGSGAAVLQ